jgi:hypothetical protein
MTDAERLFHRFAGLSRAHGATRLKGVVTGKGKHEAHSETVRKPATVELWEQHLAGTYGIGIVPIRDDATCCFGAIDIDQYDKDLSKLADQIVALQLPLVPCRTKSGGVHLYLFTKEPTPATLVRERLMEWAVLLGHSGVEIFPKQSRLASENDIGNWINMPYYQGDATNRYAIAAGGKKMSVRDFLDHADVMAVSVGELQDWQTVGDASMGEWWVDAPPCLQSLAAQGFGEGGRNNALFNIGVYLRKRFGDETWQERLDSYNQKFMSPPLGHKEVAQVARSVNKKAYEYQCNQMPCVAACNRQICLTRAHGVGTGDGDPGVVFGGLVKLDTKPPLWIWDVDGARIELSTTELKDQQRFHTKVIEKLNKWPLMVKPKRWSEIIREKLSNCEVVDVPPDASMEGQVWALLEQYCTGRATAKSKEELALHKPWTDSDADDPLKEKPYIQRTWFSAVHFRQYLEKERIKVDERQLWLWLRNRGAKHKFFNIKGRGINCWGVPAFTAQNEDYSIPSTELDPL